MGGRWVATYRLQLHGGFPLDAAAGVLPYLTELGISHVYLSPCLQAAPGSQHGYDVTDPTRISDELGGEAAWSRFVERARDLDLRILLDIVPNHMSASEHNPWWDHVLAHGPFSEFAAYFDIRIPAHQPFRVHLCTLARAYGEALEAGELSIDATHLQPRFKHYDNTWPLGPASWGALLSAAGSRAENDSCFFELEQLTGLEAPDAAQRARYWDCTARAAQLLNESKSHGRMQSAVEAINKDNGRLDAILQNQFFMLHGWKLAGELTNYRRFFDVGSLIGIRTESPEVVAATHARVATMVSRGEVDGLRVDHPDGLRDPLTYFKRLREFLPDGRVYVEKILENDERLMDDWPIDGTVGYEFLAKVNRLWMDDQRIDALTATYSDFTGHPVNFAALVRQKKREIIESTFSADLERLAVAAI
jgi:(1->4)-alpha-D-glucan 1-alpha-D-glucosylmutase